MSLSGCEQSSGTGGALIEIEAQASLVAPPAGWVNAHGWQVELFEAQLLVEGIYLYENAPPLASRAPTVTERALALLIAPAYAHPGDDHFSGGRVMTELLEPTLLSVDNAPVMLGRADAIEGQSRSVSLALREDAQMGGVARLRGVATRADEVIPFEGALRLGGDALRTRIDGIPAEVVLRDGARLSLQIHVAQWLDQMAFDDLLEADGPRQIAPDTQPYLAWGLSARRAQAFTLKLEE